MRMLGMDDGRDGMFGGASAWVFDYLVRRNIPREWIAAGLRSRKR